MLDKETLKAGDRIKAIGANGFCWAVGDEFVVVRDKYVGLAIKCHADKGGVTHALNLDDDSTSCASDFELLSPNN